MTKDEILKKLPDVGATLGSLCLLIESNQIKLNERGAYVLVQSS